MAYDVEKLIKLLPKKDDNELCRMFKNAIDIISNNKPLKQEAMKMLSATETESGYLFETVQQVTVTIIVEGEVAEEGGSSSGDTDSLLPGPSFISVILILSALVYRRRK